MKRILFLLLLVLGMSRPVAAQISIPNTFVPFTTISAAAVNANFSALGSDALNRTGGTLTGNLTVQTGVTIDGADISTYLLGAGKLKAAATSSDAFTDAGGLVAGTGAVQIIDSTGKIPALTSTYFASLTFDASNLTGTFSGTFSGTLSAISGASLTNLNASNLASGTVATARLGTGSATNASFLRGDGTWAKSIVLTEYDNGSSGSSILIDWAANGPVQKVTRTASATYTLGTPATPGTYILKMVHTTNATAYTVTFSPSVKFPNGTAPTWTNTSSAIDVITLYWDGAVWFGVQTPNFS